jgi:hypothetical protein
LYGILRKKNKSVLLRRTLVHAAFVSCLCTAGWICLAFTSDNGTDGPPIGLAIALLATPVFALVVGIACIPIVWSLNVLWLSYRDRHFPLRPVFQKVAWAILFVHVAGIPPVVYGWSLERRADQSKDQAELRSLSTHAMTCINRGIRVRVASNKSTPLDVLVRLQSDRHGDVRSEVASNPNTTSAMLVQMWRQAPSLPYSPAELRSFKSHLARNANAPEEVLWSLRRDAALWIRACVAYNKKLSHALLRDLLEKNEGTLLLEHNRTVTNEVLEEFTKDQDARVASTAKFILGSRNNPNIGHEFDE